MTTNRVLAHKTLELVTKAGKRLVIGAATKTELWERPEAGITAATTEAFKKAVVEYTLELPEGTEKVIWREAEHDEKDPHFTAVCYTKEDKYIETKYFPKVS